MKQLRLLSLDGGGVRGLSTIQILKEIMRGIRKAEGESVEPWQYFDLIGGTSTGGLLAIMLGRLRLSIDECETAYLKLSEQIFNPKRHKMNFPGKAKDFLHANGRFDADVLKEAIKDIIANPGGLDPEALLLEREDTVEEYTSEKGVKKRTIRERTIDRPNERHIENAAGEDSMDIKESGIEGVRGVSEENSEDTSFWKQRGCKVFVCAAQTGNSSCAILRSYESDLPQFLPSCKIWEACRATSAATTFFDPINIGPYKQEFADGAIIYNNPIHLLHHEAKMLWPKRMAESVFVSIGTGSAPGLAFQGNVKHIIEAMKKIVTQTERTADEFATIHGDIIQESRYFRFNVYHGLEDVGLEEYKQMAKIASAAQAYLMKPETVQMTRACVTRLCGADSAVFNRENELLRSLDFREMNHRFQEIEPSFQGSYQWIFDHGPKFIDWLKSNEGIYWISGKAGSGKSTTMKYICQHHLMQRYIGPSRGQVVLIKFFFHDRGSNLQKSFSGFLRALLHQILHSFQALRSLAVQAAEEPDQNPGRYWSEARLKEVLKSVIKQRLVYGRVYVFADGLDEFDGNDAAIGDFFKDITFYEEGQGLFLKACVASRPHNAFQDAFGDGPGMQIHQWTEQDIQRYVKDRFYTSARFKKLTLEMQQDLINNVVVRASGVFLWVKLVLNILMQGLEDGDKTEELQEKLDALPNDLDRLYLRMLQRVNDTLNKDPRTRQRRSVETARLFSVVHAARSPLTLRQLFFVIDEEINPFSSFLKPKYDRADKFKELEAEISLINENDGFLRRLNVRCGGILEIHCSRETRLRIHNSGSSAPVPDHFKLTYHGGSSLPGTAARALPDPFRRPWTLVAGDTGFGFDMPEVEDYDQKPFGNFRPRNTIAQRQAEELRLPFSGNVQYLHHTAKEYMGQLHTWREAFATEDPRPLINTNRLLMTAMLRIVEADKSSSTTLLVGGGGDLQEASTDMPGLSERELSLSMVPTHWKFIDDCLYYAQQEQMQMRKASLDILERLNATLTAKYNDACERYGLHWAAALSRQKHRGSVPFSELQHDNFISLAAEAGLGSYVKQAIWRDECMALKAGRPLIHHALPDFGSRRVWDTDLIEFLLLEGGARHNDAFRGRTAWQVFLAEMKKSAEFRLQSTTDLWSGEETPLQLLRRENHLKAIKAFVEQGADVNLTWESHPYEPLRVFLWSYGLTGQADLEQKLPPLMVEVILAMVKAGASVHREHRTFIKQIVKEHESSAPVPDTCMSMYT